MPSAKFDWIAPTAHAVVALAAVGALLVSIHVAVAVKEVHVMMNSRFTEMLELTRDASKAEGLKQGREERR